MRTCTTVDKSLRIWGAIIRYFSTTQYPECHSSTVSAPSWALDHRSSLRVLRYPASHETNVVYVSFCYPLLSWATTLEIYNYATTFGSGWLCQLCVWGRTNNNWIRRGSKLWSAARYRCLLVSQQGPRRFNMIQATGNIATKHTLNTPRMRYMIMWLIMGSNIDPVWTTNTQQNTHWMHPGWGTWSCG